jgi:hypothetical protein
MAELKPEEIDKAVEEPTVPRAEEARLVEELGRMEYQPLMPVEKKLWEEGIGRLAAVYLVSLFGFIIWIGLVISWLFFHGVKPPLAGQ